MNIKEQIERDLKTALLAGDKTLVTTLRGLKSAILYAEVAAGKRAEGLADPEIISLFLKETKKHQESIQLYQQGGNQEKANAELAEIKVIEKYLPPPMTDEELATLLDEVVSQFGEPSPQTMGRIIARVKELSQGRADGGRIANLVKKRQTT